MQGTLSYDCFSYRLLRHRTSMRNLPAIYRRQRRSLCRLILQCQMAPDACAGLSLWRQIYGVPDLPVLNTARAISRRYASLASALLRLNHLGRFAGTLLGVLAGPVIRLRFPRAAFRSATTRRPGDLLWVAGSLRLTLRADEDVSCLGTLPPGRRLGGLCTYYPGPA